MKRSNIFEIVTFIRNTILGSYVLMFLLFSSCKKFVTVNNVSDNILSSEVFNNSGSAKSAITGIYRMARDKVYTHTVSSFTARAGLYSDELNNPSPIFYYDEYKNNDLLPGTTDWSGYYSVIYSCNAAIEGLEAATVLSESLKQRLIGDALFIRTLCYYFLVNQYGDIPLITSTDVNLSSAAVRTEEDVVYAQLVHDLQSALEKMNTNELDRTKANRMSVQSLLARIFLYQKDFVKAEITANDVIESGIYSLLNINTPLYTKDNSEAMFQFANTENDIIQESRDFLIVSPPPLFVTESLANTFELNDLRMTNWLKPYNDNGMIVYYIPYKFKGTNAGSTELYTPLRLAEQYLIRAEARIQQGKVEEGVSDLNSLRARASLPAPDNLPLLSLGLSKENALLAVEQERRIELCFDMGHRFFDIKRTGRINTIMNLHKPGVWNTRSIFFPIPLVDLQRNPALKQNSGYE
jgi:starch-binding outer membrane protein, SusD/RagB family